MPNSAKCARIVLMTAVCCRMKRCRVRCSLMLHRTRHLFIRQQTAVINTIRAHLAEFGIVAPVGRNGVEELLYAVADQRDERIPEVARGILLSQRFVSCVECR